MTHANPLGVSLSDKSSIASNETHADLYKRHEVSRDTLAELQYRLWRGMQTTKAMKWSLLTILRKTKSKPNRNLRISHFRDHLSLHFKARLSAKSLLWKSVSIHIEIGTYYHNTKISQDSLWKRDRGELGNGLLNYTQTLTLMLPIIHWGGGE